MEYKSLEFKAEDVDVKQRLILGYASTWDKDLGNDVIVKGAFANTLVENAGRVKVLWQHQKDNPIGKPKLMREDDKGLWTESYVAKTARGEEALELAKEGIIDSMSIGFTVNEEDEEYREDGVRVIKSLKLYEYSLVTWPMNENATITGVKNFEPGAIERLLREAGLTRSQAKKFTCSGLKGLREVDLTKVDAHEITEALRSISNTARGK